MRYAALLRGVNVGGHKALTMDALRAVFQGMGFENVRTVQASGNVVFDRVGDEATTGGQHAFARGAPEVLPLTALIGDELERILGYRIAVIVRRSVDLQALVASHPFQEVEKSPETRLYVSFLSRPVGNQIDISLDARVRLVALTEGEVLTAITLSSGWGTTELMAWLEKQLGKDVTTRNWNTVVKVAET